MQNMTRQQSDSMVSIASNCLIGGTRKATMCDCHALQGYDDDEDNNNNNNNHYYGRATVETRGTLETQVKIR